MRDENQRVRRRAHVGENPSDAFTIDTKGAGSTRQSTGSRVSLSAGVTMRVINVFLIGEISIQEIDTRQRLAG